MNVKSVLCASALVVMLAACGGAATSGSATATTSATPAAGAAATAAPAATGKVNANTASIDQMTAAFTAAGISSPARWAREVDEYRPYPTNDPNMAKLRQNLAKYNPGEETVNKIIATLSLS